MRVNRQVIAGLISLVMLSGCGQSGPTTPIVPAGGTVTYNGKPIEGATVSFMAEAAPRAASGVTDVNGEFKLSMFKLNDGAAIGENKVVIVKANPAAASTSSITPDQMLADPAMLAKQAAEGAGNKNVPASLIPEKYGSLMSSPLKETVTEKGPNQFVIQLTD